MVADITWQGRANTQAQVFHHGCVISKYHQNKNLEIKLPTYELLGDTFKLPNQSRYQSPNKKIMHICIINSMFEVK
jgi:hypothetical protein